MAMAIERNHERKAPRRGEALRERDHAIRERSVGGHVENARARSTENDFAELAHVFAQERLAAAQPNHVQPPKAAKDLVHVGGPKLRLHGFIRQESHMPQRALHR